MILSKADTNRECNGWTALGLAVFNNNIDVVNLLLKHKDTRVNQCTSNGRTALHIAAKHCRIDHTLILLAARANVFSRIDDNHNVLHLLGMNTKTNLKPYFCLLLAHGAAPCLIEADRYTGRLPGHMDWQTGMLPFVENELKLLLSVYRRELGYVIPITVLVDLIVKYLC